MDRPLLDRTGIWLGAGGVLAAFSAVPISVGASQRVGNDSLWSNGWFVLGVIVFALGFGCLFWAAVLATAHWYAAGHLPEPVATPLGVAEDGGEIGPVVRFEKRVVHDGSHTRAGVDLHNQTDEQLVLYAQVVEVDDAHLDQLTPWWLWPDLPDHRAIVPPRGRVFLSFMNTINWDKQPDGRWSAPDVEPWFHIEGLDPFRADVSAAFAQREGRDLFIVRVWNEPRNEQVMEFNVGAGLREGVDRLRPDLNVTSRRGGITHRRLDPPRGQP